MPTVAESDVVAGHDSATVRSSSATIGVGLVAKFVRRGREVSDRAV
jgi:hypothetical protein